MIKLPIYVSVSYNFKILRQAYSLLHLHQKPHPNASSTFLCFLFMQLQFTWFVHCLGKKMSANIIWLLMSPSVISQVPVIARYKQFKIAVSFDGFESDHVNANPPSLLQTDVYSTQNALEICKRSLSAQGWHLNIFCMHIYAKCICSSQFQ